MKNLKEILEKHKVIIGVIAVVLTLALAISAFLFVLIQRDSNISGRDAVITNVTDTAFTVTWVSDDPYVGRIVYQEGSEWRPLFAQQGLDYAWDDRDVELNDVGEYVQVEEGVKERYTHHVTIRNLKPDTVYTFRVGGSINGKELSANTVKTREIIEELNTPDPAYGQIENINPEDAFIIIGDKNDTSETAPLISSPVSENGTYSVDANFFGRDNIAGDELYAIVRSEQKIISQHDYESEGYKPLDTIIVTDTTVSEQQNNRTTGQSLLSDVNALGSCPVNSCIVINTTTNIREDAGTQFQVLSAEGNGVEKQIHSCKNGWYEVDTNNSQRGYVLGSLFTTQQCTGAEQSTPETQDTSSGSGVEEDNTETPPAPPTTSVSGSFNCDGLGNVVTYRANQGINIRPQPNTTQSSIGGLSAGQTIQGCSGITEGEIVWGGDSDWVKVDKNGEAYIYAQLLTQVEGSTEQAVTEGIDSNIESESAAILPQDTIDREGACWESDSTNNLNIGETCNMSNDRCVVGSVCTDSICAIDESSGCSEDKDGFELPQDLNAICIQNNVETGIIYHQPSGSCISCNISQNDSQVTECPRISTVNTENNSEPSEIALIPNSTNPNYNVSVNHLNYGDNRARLMSGYLRELPLNATPDRIILHWTGNASNVTCADDIKIRFTPQTREVNGEIIANSCSNYAINQDGSGLEIVPVGRACIQAHNAVLNSGYGMSIENCGAGGLGVSLTNSQVLSNVQIISRNIDNGNLSNNACIIGHYEAAPPPLRYDPGYEFLDAVCSELKDRGYPVKCAIYGECNAQPQRGDVAMTDKDIQKLASNNSLISQVNAQIEDNGGSGFFNIEAQGYRPVRSAYIEQGSTLSFYVDTNGNSKKDPGEETIDSGSLMDIELRKISSDLKFEFPVGWSTFSINGTPENGNLTAKSMLEDIAGQGGLATHVGEFNNGKWNIYSKRGNNYIGDDFDILPGHGYFVLNRVSFDYLIEINEVEKEVPIIVQNGWNLVGFSGYDSLDTDLLLDSANNQNLELTTISQFENGRYDSVVQNEGVRFGNSFNIIDKRGYFIRVESFEDQIFTP